MKTNARNLAILTVALVALATGCATQQAPVAEAPPEAQHEIQTPAPNANSIWVEGHWSWQNHWTWVPGHWIQRPNMRAAWEAGKWVHTRKGWVWHDGQWRDTAAP